MSETSGIAQLDAIVVPDQDDYLSILFPANHQKRSVRVVDWVLRGHENEIVVWKERKA